LETEWKTRGEHRSESPCVDKDGYRKNKETKRKFGLTWEKKITQQGGKKTRAKKLPFKNILKGGGVAFAVVFGFVDCPNQRGKSLRLKTAITGAPD